MSSPIITLVASLKSQGSVSTCALTYHYHSNLSISVFPRKLTAGTSGLCTESLLLAALGKAVVGTLFRWAGQRPLGEGEVSLPTFGSVGLAVSSLL